MFALPNTSTANANSGIGGAPTTNGLFGLNASTPQSTPAPSSNLFQPPNTVAKSGGLFGNLAASTPSPAANNLFGKPTSTTMSTGTGGLLGGLNSNAGAATSTGLFSKTPAAPSVGGLFGNATSTPSNGLFGNNSKQTPTSNSLFSKPTTLGLSGTNQFGTSNGTTSGGLFGNSSSTFSQPQPAANQFGNNSFFQNNGSQQTVNNPYGLVINSSITGDVMPPALTTSHKTKGFAHKPSKAKDYHKPRTTSSLLWKLSSRFSSAKSDETSGIFSSNYEGPMPVDKKSILNGPTFSVSKKDISNIRKLKIDSKRIASTKEKLFQNYEKAADKSTKLVSRFLPAVDKETIKEKTIFDFNNNEPLDDNESELSEDIDVAEQISDEQPLENEKSVIDYWCSPTVEELEKMSEKEISIVTGFVIGRKGYGTITFNFDVDLSAFAGDFKKQLFGKTVLFHENKTVEVYPENSEKPTVGNGLNVPATIALENIYPAKHKTDEEIKDVTKFVKKLKNQNSTDFVSYTPFGGIWVFKVKHFSIYGVCENDDEDDNADNDTVIINNDDGKPETPQYLQTRQMPVPGTFDSAVQIQQSPVVNTNVEFLTMPLETEELELLIENPEILNEMDYEPSDVEAEDIDALENKPDLSVSDDLVEQLRLVNSTDKSIFNKKTFRMHDNLDTLLFNSFNAKVEKHKEIVKQRRLEHNPNFAHFNKNSTISIKSPDSLATGSKIVELPFVKSDEFLMDIFVDIIPRSVFAQRATNEFPKVSSIGFQFKNLMKIQPNDSKWQLLSILFDSIKIKDPVENDTVKSVLVSKKQFSKLCHWINLQIADELNRLISKSANDLEKIFYYLVQKNTIAATKLCISSGNAHLAPMVAMCTSNDFRFQQLSKTQLSKWSKLGCSVDPFITKIYQIFAHEVVYIEELDWLSNFASYINYADINEKTLEEEVEYFFNTTICDFKNSDLLVSIFTLFYSIPHNSQNEVLKTFKFNETPLDYVFPWFIVQVLFLKNKISIDATQKDILSLNFLEQLKMNSLLEECVYVTTFLENDTLAKEQFKTVIRANINKFEENTNYLVKLKIPESEIYYSLALLYKNQHNYLKETQFYLKANKYTEAIKVVTHNLGPELLLKNTKTDHNTLSTIINEFPAICKNTKWNESIGVYEMYLKYLGTKDISYLKELIKYVQVFNSDNGYLLECRAALNRICEFTILEFLKNKDTLNGNVKDMLLKLPLGEPEKLYTHRLLNAK